MWLFIRDGKKKEETLIMKSVFPRESERPLFLSVIGRTPVLRVSVVANHCINKEPSYSFRYCDQVTDWCSFPSRHLKVLPFSATSGRLLDPPSLIHWVPGAHSAGAKRQSRLRIGGSVPPLPCMPSWSTQVQL